MGQRACKWFDVSFRRTASWRTIPVRMGCGAELVMRLIDGANRRRDAKVNLRFVETRSGPNGREVRSGHTAELAADLNITA
jgi:hypothetical protein